MASSGCDWNGVVTCDAPGRIAPNELWIDENAPWRTTRGTPPWPWLS
jgi:hypothetical protein